MKPLNTYFAYTNKELWLRARREFHEAEGKDWASWAENNPELVEAYFKGEALLRDYRNVGYDYHRSDDDDLWLQEVQAFYNSVGLNYGNLVVPREFTVISDPSFWFNDDQ